MTDTGHSGPIVVGSNFGFQQHSLEFFLDSMVELDLPTIEFWAIAPHLDFIGGGAAEYERVGQMLRHRDLRVHCLTLEQVMYPLNIAAADPGLNRRSIDHFLRAADIASSWGTPLLFLTTGRGLRDEPAGAAWRRSVNAVREIANHAASVGVRCVLEPLQPHESDIVNSASDLATFLNDVGDHRVAVALDTVAMAAAGDTIESYFARFGDRIAHVQFVDGRPTGHLAWGDGDLPLSQYVHDLVQHGYSGAVGFEVFGPPTYRNDPVGVLRQCVTGFRNALSAAQS